jgi:hypothetical protein
LSELERTRAAGSSVLEETYREALKGDQVRGIVETQVFVSPSSF